MCGGWSYADCRSERKGKKQEAFPIKLLEQGFFNFCAGLVGQAFWEQVAGPREFTCSDKPIKTKQ